MPAAGILETVIICLQYLISHPLFRDFQSSVQLDESFVSEWKKLPGESIHSCSSVMKLCHVSGKRWYLLVVRSEKPEKVKPQRAPVWYGIETEEDTLECTSVLSVH